MRDLKLTIATAIGTVMIAFLAIKSEAAQPEPPKQEVVRFADLNLATPEGAQMLYKRLKAAARRVCKEPGLHAMGQRRFYRDCVEQAMSGAVASINSSALTEVYMARSGPRPQPQVAKVP